MKTSKRKSASVMTTGRKKNNHIGNCINRLPFAQWNKRIYFFLEANKIEKEGSRFGKSSIGQI